MESRISALHPDDIRRRLRGTAPPDDPTRVELQADGRDWPRELLAQFDAPLTPSAVLVPIVARPGGLTVLLTERSAHLAHHPGQISFPGGRVEPGDRDLVHTALRETREEVGIPPDAVDVAGYLSPMPTVTGYAVTPVVGIVADSIELTLDPREVAAAFEVPLEFLLDKANRQHATRQYRGVDIPVISFHYAERRIWGATAAMIVSLEKKINN